MNIEDRRIGIAKMLKKQPECLTVSRIRKCTRFGSNHIYGLIRSGTLLAFIYREQYTVFKSDLIDLLAERWFVKYKKYRVAGHEDAFGEGKYDEPDLKNNTSADSLKYETSCDCPTELDKRFNRCPNMMSPNTVRRWTVYGENTIYRLIKSGELKSITYQGRYIVAKSDLLEYLCAHCDEPNRRKYHLKQNDAEAAK